MPDHCAGAIVVESQALCRRGLVALLATKCGFGTVLETEHFSGLLGMLDQMPSGSIVTLDGCMPDIGVSQGIRQLRYNYPHLRLALVASNTDRDSALEALAAGVHGVIPKALPEREMIVAFNMIAGGGIYVPNVISDVGVRRRDNHNTSQSAQLLTERQRQVLSLLVRGKSNKEIARALCIAEGTVKVHIAAAFKLLGVHNRVGAFAALQGNQFHQHQSMTPDVAQYRTSAVHG